jgi:polysaccharide export outer membrane protein
MEFYYKYARLGACLLVSVLMLAGCASGGATVPAAQCTAPSVETTDYIVGPGDTLQVVVWRNDELSAVVPVRPDGKVSTPLIDDMQAAGKTPSALASDMELILAEYLRTPDVSVIVKGQGAANQIQIVGEVAAPQSLSYRAGIRVLDIVVGAGGLGEFAAGNRANLIRETGNGQIKCNVKLRDLMAGDMSQNIPVFPGDVLVIPESRF